MKRERFLITLSVSILTIALILTLMPLILMFYTSIKPGGTLFKAVDEIVVADFDQGQTNSIGGLIEARVDTPSTIALSHGDNRDTLSAGRSQIITYNRRPNAAVSWWTQLGQDMRRFKTLEFGSLYG